MMVLVTVCALRNINVARTEEITVVQVLIDSDTISPPSRYSQLFLSQPERITNDELL